MLASKRRAGPIYRVLASSVFPKRRPWSCSVISTTEQSIRFHYIVQIYLRLLIRTLLRIFMMFLFSVFRSSQG